MNAREVIFLGYLSLMLTVGKLALSSIPNIEIVSFLFVLYTLELGLKKTMLIAVVFSTVEILIWGFGLWTFGYYFFWPLLILIVQSLKDRIHNPIGWAVVSGLFGLSFGLLFAIYTAPLSHVPILVYWINGLSFDFIHMVGNFTLMLILYKPIKKVLHLGHLKMNKA